MKWLVPQMGGMGIVYLCHDRQEDRPVALKTFKPEYLPDRATGDRILREGDTWTGWQSRRATAAPPKWPGLTR
jgi:serine/threonine protein kinase